MESKKTSYDKRTQERQAKERKEHGDRVNYRVNRSKINTFLKYAQRGLDKEIDIGDYNVQADIDEMIEKLKKFKQKNHLS